MVWSLALKNSNSQQWPLSTLNIPFSWEIKKRRVSKSFELPVTAFLCVQNNVTQSLTTTLNRLVTCAQCTVQLPWQNGLQQSFALRCKHSLHLHLNTGADTVFFLLWYSILLHFYILIRLYLKGQPLQTKAFRWTDWSPTQFGYIMCNATIKTKHSWNNIWWADSQSVVGSGNDHAIDFEFMQTNVWWSVLHRWGGQTAAKV